MGLMGWQPRVADLGRAAAQAGRQARPGGMLSQAAALAGCGPPPGCPFTSPARPLVGLLSLAIFHHFWSGRRKQHHGGVFCRIG